ncbi:MAG: hypothetical protein ACFFAN_04485 [Promethearchaeota archaeon]
MWKTKTVLEKPAEIYNNNYYAQIDPELCIGCETFLDCCQVGAFRFLIIFLLSIWIVVLVIGFAS